MGHGEVAGQAERFRPTFVVAADEPYAEDSWRGREVTIGDAVLRVHDRIGRCG